MSIFTRMFRRGGGPRDSEDGTGENEPAQDEEPTGRDPAEAAAVRPAGEPDETTVPWSTPPFLGEQTTTAGPTVERQVEPADEKQPADGPDQPRTAARSPTEYSLPPGVVPRPMASAPRTRRPTGGTAGGPGGANGAGGTTTGNGHARHTHPATGGASPRATGSSPVIPAAASADAGSAGQVHPAGGQPDRRRSASVPPPGPPSGSPRAAGGPGATSLRGAGAPGPRVRPSAGATSRPGTGSSPSPTGAARSGASASARPGSSGGAAAGASDLGAGATTRAAGRLTDRARLPLDPAAPVRARPAPRTSAPPPTRLKPNTGDVSDMLSELDRVSTGAAPHTPIPAEHPTELGGDRVTTADDRAALRDLFAELAGHHLAQLRDLMIEVQGGTALAGWIDLSLPAVSSVRAMAEQLELGDLCAALDRLSAALETARAGGGAITGPARDGLLDAYQPLLDLVPGALELDGESGRREPIIAQALLRQVPGVETLAIERIVAASLLSITALADARPDELAAVTGLPLELAGAVVDRFRAYRAQAGVVAAPDPAAEHAALAELLATLRAQNAAHDEAARGWSPEDRERKRATRRERAATLLRIHVCLARLGQVDRLVELDRLSFRRKADTIERFLIEARQGRA